MFVKVFDRSVLIALFGIILICGCECGCTPVEDSPKPTTQRFDENDISEEKRRLIRDKMIENGSDPAEAEVFTRELYNAEREHRQNNGL